MNLSLDSYIQNYALDNSDIKMDMNRDRATTLEEAISSAFPAPLPPRREESFLSPSNSKKPETSRVGGVALSTGSPMRLSLLAEIVDIESPLLAIQIPREILEVAEEIADGSDTPGFEPYRLRLLVQSVLFGLLPVSRTLS